MRKIFSIEWPDNLGPDYLDEETLRSCLFSVSCYFPNIKVEITDKTPLLEEISKNLKRIAA